MYVDGGGSGDGTPDLRPPQRCRVGPSEKVKYLVYLVFGMLYPCYVSYVFMYTDTDCHYITDDILKLRNSLSYTTTEDCCDVIRVEVYQ